MVCTSLSYDELSQAKVKGFRNVQHVTFDAKIVSLEKSKVLPKGSSLRKSESFMVEDGLL